MNVLYGGAFDPPHLGHVALARAAADRFAPAPVRVLVAAAPGHKRTHAPADARLRMARAAFADVPGARVELDEHAYTVDRLREEGRADSVLVLGADQLADLASWKQPRAVLRLARLAVGARPGTERDALDGLLDELGAHDRVELLELAAVDASSRALRAAVRRGEPIDGGVPPEVARIVAELGLYRESPSADGGYTAGAGKDANTR